jgi:hypothetical protein
MTCRQRKRHFGPFMLGLVVLHLARAASALPVLFLDNTSSVGFTAGVVGVNLGGPGVCCDLFFGDTDPPTPLFMYGGSPISASNPLPAGATASTGPVAGFSSGDFVEFIQVNTNAVPGSPGFSQDAALSVEILAMSPTVIPFDVMAGSTQIVGAFRVVVPEPGTLALLGSAALALAALARRRVAGP